MNGSKKLPAGMARERELMEELAKLQEAGDKVSAYVLGVIYGAKLAESKKSA